ncbi:hypothetical protein [Marinobacter similis]|uniref:hypothetical protein n=1 Tax=Marinobacter similis TaxID=1420916 RepID=UPI000AFB4A32|nr:hypothetical protein [Marinobacter similis]
MEFRTPTFRKTLISVAVASSLVVLAGCTDDGDDGTNGTSQTLIEMNVLALTPAVRLMKAQRKLSPTTPPTSACLW